MKKRKKGLIVRRILAVILTFTLLAGGMKAFAAVTERPDSRQKYYSFFSEDTQYDVLFFGTSHVINGIFPMQLWEDYGITSYNFGSHGSSLAMSCWIMQNAVEYHKPKVAVLDVFGAEAAGPGMDVSMAHHSLDAFPLTKTKAEAVRDVFPDDREGQRELLFPFYVYHSRWNQLDADSFAALIDPSRGANVEKGAESRIGVDIAPLQFPLVEKTDMWQDSSFHGFDYIRKFVVYCKENHIQPVLIHVPYPESEAMQSIANAVYPLADELDVPYLNLPYEDIVDFDTDCYDSSSHLNPSGARKVTDFIGNYLAEHCNLQSHKGEAAVRAIWDRDYETYRNFLIENIEKEKDLKSTLMLLSNENFRADILASGPYEPDAIEQKLIAQLGEEGRYRREEESAVTDRRVYRPGGVLILVYDRKTGGLICARQFRLEKNAVGE